MMAFYRRWPVRVWGPILVFSVCTGPALGARESWYGLYLMGQKIGYLALKTTPGTFRGKKCSVTEAAMKMKVSMLGSSVEVDALTKTMTGLAGNPLHLAFKSDSAGHVTTVTADFFKDAVHYTADVTGSRKEGVLRLKPGERFVTDPSGGEIPFKPRTGLKVSGKMFEPQSVSLIDVETGVTGKEKVKVGVKEYSAYRLESKTSILNATLWVDEKGEMLKMSTVLGMEMRKETRQMALGLDKSAPVDLVEQVAVLADREIPDPRNIRSAEYEMTGFSAPLALADNPIQQTQFSQNKSSYRGIFRVRALDPKTIPAIEIERIDRSRFARHLEPSVYVQSDAGKFRELARQVVGEEQSVGKAAGLICEWTHRQLKPEATIGTFRSAEDILTSGKGVCRDYATLFASVARAAGIPTKICLGLVYVRGKFMYHAWVECWIGEWAAYEPTFGSLFDATHIKLAEGDLSNIFDITRDFGRFKVKVLRYE